MPSFGIDSQRSRSSQSSYEKEIQTKVRNRDTGKLEAVKAHQNFSRSLDPVIEQNMIRTLILNTTCYGR